MLRRHLNFRQISHSFTSSFINPSFRDLNGSHIMYYYDFKSVEVQGWTPLKILIFLHLTCRPTFTTLLGKRSAISHLMAVPKNRGKCKSATISLHRGDSMSASAPPPLYSKTYNISTPFAPIKYPIIAPPYQGPSFHLNLWGGSGAMPPGGPGGRAPWWGSGGEAPAFLAF